MRDRRIDLIRGLAILLLTVTHTVPAKALVESFGHFYPKTGFLFHGADLFIALSGLVCGMVYGRNYDQLGFEVTRRKGFARALQLFFYNAMAFLAVAFIVLGFQFLRTQTEFHSLGESPLASSIGTITFISPIPYFDILGVYVIFLIALPFFVHLQKTGRQPMIYSAIIYAAYSIYRLFIAQTEPPLSDRFFVSPIAWQFLFFGFVAIGMSLREVREKLPSLQKTLPYILIYFFVMYFMRSESWVFHNFSSKFDLGVLRIVDLVLVLYVIDRAMPVDLPDRHWLGVDIASIGSNSLFCFSVTLVFCFFFSNLLAALGGGRAVYLVVILAEVLLMLRLGRILRVNDGFRIWSRAEWIQCLVERTGSQTSRP